MVSFPILSRLDIDNYGLYPGGGEEPGLHVTFEPGVTLVIGTNGLGKSTLILILFRLLTGPYDIPGLSNLGDLGFRRLEAKELYQYQKNTFAHRVVDDAKTAGARLEITLGEATLAISRSLHDLSLTGLSVNGQFVSGATEDLFQSEIINKAGVGSFGDWILLLRYLVFYFEDRRALVWDSTAQRQIFRFLFLNPATSNSWQADERAILKLDSEMRNLRSTVVREEKKLAKSESQLIKNVDVRAKLELLEKLQSVDETRLEELESMLPAVEATRQRARQRFMSVSQERESKFRQVESAKLASISSRFPSTSQTARYILSQLMSDHTCIVCGNVSEIAAQDYTSRISSHHCIVCDTDLSSLENPSVTPEYADRLFEQAVQELQVIEVAHEAAREAQQEADAQYAAHVRSLQAVRVAFAEHASDIDDLVGKLPPDETQMHQRRRELSSLRGEVADMTEELAVKRGRFHKYVNEINGILAARITQIKNSFDLYTEGFLLENCHLTWSPQREMIGQTGELFDFPSFELEMSGSDFPSPVRRSGPDQVSESQREFIDLAFRMALISLTGTNSSGSLVIDAPESSLDTVFARRAATVLSRFSKADNNRLFIASNLVEGHLIPAIVKEISPSEYSSRIINLINIAAPTAALKQLREEYDEVLTALFEESAQ